MREMEEKKPNYLSHPPYLPSLLLGVENEQAQWERVKRWDRRDGLANRLYP
jgi:hypothetical protein